MAYYISRDNEKQGPYTIEELVSRSISAETLVLAEGSNQWLPAWQVAELREILSAGAAPKKGGGAEAGDAQNVDAEAVASPKEVIPARMRRGGGRSFTVSMVAVAAILVMIATCPGKKVHQDAIRSEVSAALGQQLGESGSLIETGLQMFGKYVFGKFADSALDELLVVKNYFVVSVGRIDYDGQERIASIGVFGHVFTVDKEDIVKVLQQAEQERKSAADAADGNGLLNGFIDFLDEMMQ